ncbi:hypothetical protein SDC9_123503 [bioreactor metagenome]|uniref:Uncharacterized protein n=1 Tax=bioreactor metagenome TaxID=1076179 RepID=A0A645CHV4_9ZZZZ
MLHECDERFRILQILHCVDIVKHADVNVVGAKPGQEIVQGGGAFGNIPCLLILAVLPGGADMPLNEHLFAPTLQHLADEGPKVGRRHVNVNDIYTARHGGIHHGGGRLKGFAVEIFASKPHDTRREVCFSQSAVLHIFPSVIISFRGLPGIMLSSITPKPAKEKAPALGAEASKKTYLNMTASLAEPTETMPTG